MSKSIENKGVKEKIGLKFNKVLLYENLQTKLSV